MNLYTRISITLVIIFSSAFSNAATQKIDSLTIKMIRSVGEYHSGDTFDDTVELWFTTSLAWTADVGCTANFRVYIDASKTHMISAAYMAFAAGKKVNINADDTLPVRSGACELSYIDVSI